MDCNVRRESCSHAPLEILRQDALQGRWSEARQTCCRVGLSECLDLDVLWSVWAQDADAVSAAVARAERQPRVRTE
jgi:hypothetical protein